MDRRLIAGLLGLLLGGCAMSRSGMPAGRQGDPVAMDEVDALPPVGDVLVKTYAQRDAATRRAGQSPESPPFEDPPPPNLPPGRPAPFAGRTTGSPRVQSAPPSGRPEDQPASPRPAPFADRPPAGPRPQSPSTQPAPTPADAASTQPAPAPAEAASTQPAPTPAEAAPTPAASTPDPTAVPPPSPFTAAPPTLAKEAPADPQVRPASTSPPPPATPPAASAPKGVLSAANGKAATVGTEVITIRQVWAAVVEKRDKVGDPRQWSNPQFKQQAFFSTLNHLIDRALLVQAAKKRIKDLKQFNDEVDKQWVERELPSLLREQNVSNIHELKHKFAGMGRSLDQIREDYRLSILAQDYLHMQLKGKLHIDFPEMYEYYNANKGKFRRSAQIVWREVEIDISKCPSRADARARADAILDRLRKGDEFARLARSGSHGATAKEGGRWETAPGGSANADINAALAGLAPGQTSGVIEVPGAFHIVRLESRRDEGIAPFPDVQGQIKESIFTEKVNKYSEEILASLRSKTVITTVFDNPQFDAAAVRTGARPKPPARR